MVPSVILSRGQTWTGLRTSTWAWWPVSRMTATVTVRLYALSVLLQHWQYKKAGHTDLIGTMPENEALHIVGMSILKTFSSVYCCIPLQPPPPPVPYLQMVICTNIMWVHGNTHTYSKGWGEEQKGQMEKVNPCVMYFCSISTEALHIVQSPLLLWLSVFFVLSIEKIFLVNLLTAEATHITPVVTNTPTSHNIRMP
jgi:hypothetical protein